MDRTWLDFEAASSVHPRKRSYFQTYYISTIDSMHEIVVVLKQQLSLIETTDDHLNEFSNGKDNPYFFKACKQNDMSTMITSIFHWLH